jgi:hypothetical protein
MREVFADAFVKNSTGDEQCALNHQIAKSLKLCSQNVQHYYLEVGGNNARLLK